MLTGTREVASAITSSTITTIAVFLPLGVVGGIISQFFLPFALTVTYALLASLIVALTVIPVLAYFLVKVKGVNSKIPYEVKSDREEISIWGRIYLPILGLALRRRATKFATLAISAALFVGAAILVVELSPENRKAEAASYLSVAVFGGLSIGPIIGELVMGDVAETARGLSAGHFDAVFLVTAGAAVLAALVSLTAPAFVGERPARIRRKVSWFHKRSLLPGAILAVGMAAWTAFTSFVPTFSKSIGLNGSAQFFALYSILCLFLRLFGAKTPERIGLHRSVVMAMSFLLCGVTSVAVLGNAFGIWLGTVFFALGISFFYPSLLAMAVEGSDANERVEIVSSFTSFFEIGGVIGGLALGLIGELFGERATFVGGMVFATLGLMLLARTRQQAAPATAS